MAGKSSPGLQFLSECIAGLHAMMALRAGAHHITAVERWLYLSLACKESLVANKFPAERYKVVYKRPTDLALIQDVPIICNLLICNIFDEGDYPTQLSTACFSGSGFDIDACSEPLPNHATADKTAQRLRSKLVVYQI